MSADEALGRRIREIREIQGLGVQEFGDRVRERVGKGWSHAVSYTHLTLPTILRV